MTLTHFYSFLENQSKEQPTKKKKKPQYIADFKQKEKKINLWKQLLTLSPAIILGKNVSFYDKFFYYFYYSN